MSSISNEVLMVLDAARDAPEILEDKAVRDVLEAALADIWSRVQANESEYIMTRDEFAIFNFFQDRFRNNPVATSARRRFWDSLSVAPTETQAEYNEKMLVNPLVPLYGSFESYDSGIWGERNQGIPDLHRMFLAHFPIAPQPVLLLAASKKRRRRCAAELKILRFGRI
ncbi:hypothetical protein GGR50DRAFT_103055 [Xylaria sp. CBS 124048]|nr:hypothetical protein GGR50DRAFT_103055 [Xylaria sp. CBS 124048]